MSRKTQTQTIGDAEARVASVRCIGSRRLVKEAGELLRSGLTGEASAVLEDALGSDPDNIEVLRALARVRMSEHRPDLAAALLKHVLRLFQLRKLCDDAAAAHQPLASSVDQGARGRPLEFGATDADFAHEVEREVLFARRYDELQTDDTRASSEDSPEGPAAQTGTDSQSEFSGRAEMSQETVAKKASSVGVANAPGLGTEANLGTSAGLGLAELGEHAEEEPFACVDSQPGSEDEAEDEYLELAPAPDEFSADEFRCPASFDGELVGVEDELESPDLLAECAQHAPWEDVDFGDDVDDESPTPEDLSRIPTKLTREARAIQVALDLGTPHGWDKDGIRLLASLFERYWWSATQVALRRELEAGVEPRELALAEAAREVWRSYPEFATAMTWRDGTRYQRYSALPWPTALSLVRAFHGYPDAAELEVFLVEAYDEWASSEELPWRFDSFYSYLRYRIGYHQGRTDTPLWAVFRSDTIDDNPDYHARHLNALEELGIPRRYDNPVLSVQREGGHPKEVVEEAELQTSDDAGEHAQSKPRTPPPEEDSFLYRSSRLTPRDLEAARRWLDGLQERGNLTMTD